MEQETLFHLIALGDKAKDALLKLRSDLGKWFSKEFVSENSYRYLLAIVDDSTSPKALPKVRKDEESGKLNTFVIDISAEPGQSKWENVLSYIWISSSKQYDTLKYFFQVLYHDALFIHSIISFDFNDWMNVAKGQYSLKLWKIHLDDKSLSQLSELPYHFSPDGKYIIVAGLPTFKKGDVEKHIKVVNALFDRLPEDSVRKWTVIGKELPREETYVALLQLSKLHMSI